MTGRPRSMYGRRKQRPLPKTHFEKGVVMVQRRVRRWTAGLAVVLLGVLLWPAPSSAWPTDATTFSGQATGVRATVLGITAVLADTGPLPPSGGAREASLLDASAGGLSAEVVHASTIGQGDRTRSEASLANVSLALEGNTVSATFLAARAIAACTEQGPQISGSSEVADLVVNGQPIVVTGAPNQTIPLPVGSVIINEQNGSTTGTTGEMTVNALHVKLALLAGTADIVIASAHADIGCAQKVCDPSKEFVTGGGWIMGPSGAKANFAVAGGKEPGWGHLIYSEHGSAALRVKATAITGYTNLGGTVRRVEGTADVNGQPGTFQADVADNGEPGRADTFALRLSNGYAAFGMLDGGNIQLHSPCQ